MNVLNVLIKNPQNLQNKIQARLRKKVWFIAVFSMVVLEQMIKWWQQNQGSFILNQGVAWGLDLGVDWQGLGLGILLGLILLLIWQLGFCWQSSLVVAGGLSNWLDRVRLGGVVDYITIGNFPSFNLADVLITSGVGLLLIKKIKWNRQ